ncbi:DNA polymerase family B domain-containing protein [Ditylenchus destructor]|uniref:DNA polymerase n=1 Tax=Ditylenchus destructor TaxID=166010 RepID=A0AAD4R9N0_9BILA|nr:DNA polymerase family B domain-containing protein [Ditylenchus destructor]
MKWVRLRNVCCEYYLEPPNKFSEQKYGSSTYNNYPVSVIRIFGITDRGAKCCVHVHGVLPYIVFRSRSRLTADLEDFLKNIIHDVICKANESKARSFSFSLDGAVYTMYDEKARSIYGFHEAEEYFVRVVFRDPKVAKLCGHAFQTEALHTEFLQPYNAHIPFILQFFIDFSIFGMDYLYLSKTYRRTNPVLATEFTPTEFHAISPLDLHTNMNLEYDIFTDDILNPYLSLQGKRNNQGLEFIWDEELKRTRLLSQPPPTLPSFDRDNAENIESISQEEEDYLGELRNIFEKMPDTTKNELDSSEIVGATQRVSLASRAGELQESTCFYATLDEDEVSDDGDMWEQREHELMGYNVAEEQEGDEEQDANLIDETLVADSDSDVDDERLEPDAADDLKAYGAKILHHKINGAEIMNCGNYVEPDVPYEVKLFGSLDEGSLFDSFPQVDQQVDESIRQLNANVYMQNEAWHINDSFGNLPAQIYSPISRLRKHSLTMSERNRCKLLRSVTSGVNHLCVMSLECLPLPEEKTYAEPDRACVVAIFYAVNTDVCNPDRVNCRFRGCIALQQIEDNFADKNVYKFVQNEQEMYSELIRIVRKFDPDILLGYDTTRFSWGYLFERTSFLRTPLAHSVSRIRDYNIPNVKNFLRPPHGRIMLEAWSIIRREVPLRCYRFASVVKTILKKNFPELSVSLINHMLMSDEAGVRTSLLRHFMQKCELNIDLLSTIDVFIRTSQMARVYGIQFTEVLSRGSQFRVESMLLRLAKRQRFFAPSISPEQRNRMGVPETIPLNLEPQSGIYRDPVVVLDFQSLYPSICIAYNYCFTTCIGKIHNLKTLKSSTSQSGITLGALQYNLPNRLFLRVQLEAKGFHVTPTGGVFVKQNIREGLLSVMLKELLDTRVMVKISMKKHIEDEHLLRLLEARQLALKMVANVTYGYTAANWSGRMPCDEVADAIVSKGRETLENAIKYVNENGKNKYAGARVIYGDTDSLFVLFEGCTREQAFTVGNKIAEDITEMNPYPVKLKFEKVLQPCVLLTKKRYIGMSFESPHQHEGEFLGKGIETVRRDSCPFVAKLMERTLRVLFDESVDSSLQYLRYSLIKLTEVPIYDFVLSSKYRAHYSENAVIPIKKIASEMASISDRMAPLRCERVSYVITEPRTKTKETATVTSCAVSVESFLTDDDLKISYDYYITRQLFPALMQVYRLVPTSLRWKILHADKCRGCNYGSWPWCKECMSDESLYVGMSRMFWTCEVNRNGSNSLYKYQLSGNGEIRKKDTSKSHIRPHTTLGPIVPIQGIIVFVMYNW